MSDNCWGAQKCSQNSIENIDILGIPSKYKYFTIRFSMVMKIILRIHFVKISAAIDRHFFIRILTRGLFESESMLWKFMGKPRKFSFSTDKSF